MGKVLVEKLLRSCPDLEKLYVLMREKKGKTPRERLAKIVDLPVSIYAVFSFWTTNGVARQLNDFILTLFYLTVVQDSVLHLFSLHNCL